MKLFGKKILEEDYTLYKDSKFLIIENAENNKKYEIVYNNENYPLKNIDNTLIFDLKNIYDINSISINVFNEDGKYLYSTNTIELIGKNKDLSLSKDIQDNIILQIDKLKNKQQENSQNFMQKWVIIDNSLNILKEKISKIKDYDDNKISNEIKVLYENFDDLRTKIDSIKTYNYDSNIKEINEKINSLDFYDKNHIDNISNEINKIYDDFNEYNIKILEQIKNLKDDNLKLNNNSNSLTVQISKLEEDFDNLFQNIIGLKEFTNQSFDFLKEEINSLIKNKLELNEFDLFKKNEFNELQKKYISLSKDYKKLVEDYESFKKFSENITINLGDTDIEPFVFVCNDNNNLKKYSYSNTKSPLGVLNKNKDIIIRGKAIIKYTGDIYVGGFVYGNKDGMAENHTLGYLVISIIDKEYCEIIL